MAQEEKKKKSTFLRSKKRSIPQEIAMILVVCVFIQLLTHKWFLTVPILILLIGYDIVSYRTIDPGTLIHDCDPEKYLEYLDINLRTQRIPYFRANLLIKAAWAHLENGSPEQCRILLEQMEKQKHLTAAQRNRVVVLRAGFWADVKNDERYREAYDKVMALPEDYKKQIDIELLSLYNAWYTKNDAEFIAIRDKIRSYNRLPHQKWVILHFLCCLYCRDHNDNDGYNLSFGVVSHYGNRLRYKGLLTGEVRPPRDEVKELEEELERRNNELRLPDQF